MKRQFYSAKIITISSLLGFLYLAVVLALMDGWDWLSLYDNLPDVIIFAISISGIALARRRGQRHARNLIIFAFSINAVARIIKILMIEIYIHVIPFSPFYWDLIWTIYFIAYLSLLIGLKKSHD